MTRARKINCSLDIYYYYRPQRSWGKVVFSQASVILLTGGGVSASVHAGIPHTPQSDTPLDQTPPSRHPLDQTPPGADPPKRSMLGDTVNARSVRILLECKLVFIYCLKPKTFVPDSAVANMIIPMLQNF